MTMKTLLAACLVGLAALAAPAAAQNYPSRNIKFIVPFQAGSATDTLARILGEHVSRTLGRPVIVENMAGASGVLAAQNVPAPSPTATRC
jgi:tripartite-type tricarboxylate transporter receptor subunit TctC